jgi:hypothetical protein
MNSIDRKIMNEKVDRSKRFLKTVIQIVGVDFSLNKNFESYSTAIKGQFPFSPEACEHLNKDLYKAKQVFTEYEIDIEDYVNKLIDEIFIRPDAEAKTLNQIY